ncbi:hypothetical protein Tco_1522259 [Tanacetum coccineum]
MNSHSLKHSIFIPLVLVANKKRDKKQTSGVGANPSGFAMVEQLLQVEETRGLDMIGDVQVACDEGLSPT